MAVVKRRPNTQPAGYGPSAAQASATKKFNEDLRYVQGFSNICGAGSSSQLTVNLNAPGKRLLGIAIIPTTNTMDISNLKITFIVNSNNVLLNVGAQNLCPNYVQGMIFFPIPQPLFGNDTITATFTNASGSSIETITNVFYVPR